MTSTMSTVSYAASADASGLDKVELWAKVGAGSFSKVATDSAPGASGSFSYTAAAGDGSYSFYTRALDKAGNYEAAPASADTTTLVDTAAPASSASSPQYSTSMTMPVGSSAADTGSGVDSLELWAKAASAIAYSKIATNTAPLATGSFSYLALAGDGTYSFYTVAVDKAGNREAAPASADSTTLLDTAAPSSSASSPAYSSSTTITVSYAAGDSGSGPAAIELWAHAPAARGFSKVA